MKPKTLRGTPQHLSQSGQLEGFAYLMLSLPFKCNHRCLKCFNLLGDQPFTTGTPITLGEILKKLCEAKGLGVKVVVMAGEGEPTLDPGICQIVSYIDELGMIPIIYSNGSTLGPTIASFYRYRNACLVISIDSLKPDVYQFFTGSGRNELFQVLSNLENLRQVYTDTIEEREDLRIVRLALNTTVCSRNKDEIAKIKEFAGEDTYFICNPLARSGNAVENWSKLLDGDEEFAEHQRLARCYSESGGPLTLDRAGLCGYSINGIGIGPFGHYMTCAYTTRTNGLLGTICDCSLREAYEFKTAVECEHYQKYGRVPCLVRAESFEVFVETLSK